jgi:hypothetical protein
MAHDCVIDTAPLRRARARKDGAAKTKRVKAAAPKGSARTNSSEVAAQILCDRYTPLLTREAFTFSRMRMNQGEPRSFTSICFPGWVRA